MSRKQLAAALGISRIMLWKLIRMGMPADDVGEARRWRAANLVQSRLKQRPAATTVNTTVNVPEPDPSVLLAAGQADGTFATRGDNQHVVSDDKLTTLTDLGITRDRAADPLRDARNFRKARRDRDPWAPRPDAWAGHWLDRWKP